MADPVDDDTLAAVLALWKATPALAGLLDRLPETGRLKAPAESPRKLPYGQLACEKGRDAQRYAGTASHKDYRKVTITLYGTREQAVDGLAKVLATFSSQLGGVNQPTLAFPSGAKFICWWPLNDGRLEQDETTRQGLDVWRAVVEGEIRSVREG